MATMDERQQAGAVTHGEAAPSLSMKRLGLWLFILSETFLFAAFLTARFYLHGVSRPAEVNQPLGLVISIVLLASSLTAYRAETAASFGDQAKMRRNILGTLALGAIFLIGVAVEWTEGFHYFPPSTGFGTAFFSLTGLHAFHVVSGLAALLFVYGLSRNGRFTPGNTWAVEGTVKYWHFVDAVWVLIYPTLYLVS